MPDSTITELLSLFQTISYDAIDKVAYFSRHCELQYIKFLPYSGIAKIKMDYFNAWLRGSYNLNGKSTVFDAIHFC